MKLWLEITEKGLRPTSSLVSARIKELTKEGVKFFELKPRYKESKKQRGFYHGAICALYAFYHEGLDHRNPSDLERVHEWLKIEFNGEYVTINGKANKIGKTTLGELNAGFLERCIEDLVTNYGLDEQILDTNKYKHWRDTVYPHGGPNNYIDYLVELKLL